MDQVVCLSENSKITVHSPLLITWLIWTFQQVHVLCRLILLSSQPSQSFNLVKGCICWYSSLFSSVSSVCIQISGTWKRGTFFVSRREGWFFFFLPLYLCLSNDAWSTIYSHNLGDILYRSRKSGFFVLHNNTCWLSSDGGGGFYVFVGFLCLWLVVGFLWEWHGEWIHGDSKQATKWAGFCVSCVW